MFGILRTKAAPPAAPSLKGIKMAKYTLNLNLEPYSNVLIELDGELDFSEIKQKISDAMYISDIKKQIHADREREFLVDELGELMVQKEFDSVSVAEYLEVMNLTREKLLEADTIKLKNTVQRFKELKNKKD